MIVRPPVLVFRFETRMPYEYQSAWKRRGCIGSCTDPVQCQVQRDVDSSFHLRSSFARNYHQPDLIKLCPTQTCHRRVWHWRPLWAQLFHVFHSGHWIIIIIARQFLTRRNTREVITRARNTDLWPLQTYPRNLKHRSTTSSGKRPLFASLTPAVSLQ